MARKKTRNYDDWVTVTIKRDTKEIINKMGKYGDTFDDVLKKLLRMMK